MTSETLSDEQLEELLCELEASGFYSRQLKGLAELQQRRAAESEARATLKRLAVIMAGNDSSGEIQALTVTAASLVARCKTLAAERDNRPATIGGCDWIDWNELSRRGLLERINREILHPIGLAAFRDPKTGHSGGAMVSPDGVWQYGGGDGVKS